MDRNGAAGGDGTPYDGGMEARLGKLGSDLAVVKTDIGVMKGDMAVMRADIVVMKADIAVMKADNVVMKTDIGVIKATGATKADLAELRGETKAAIAEAKSSIIMWVVTAVFIAQLLPALLQLLIK